MSTPQYPAPQQPQWQPAPGTQPVVGGRRDSFARWLGVIGVLVGVAGLGVATWSVATRPDVSALQSTETSTTADEESFSPEEVAAAKQRICEASDLVAAAVSNSNVARDPNGDPGLINANVALSQIAFLAGASYMQNQLDPAAPPELRDMVEVLIEKYMRAVVGGAGGGNESFDRDVAEADVAAQEVQHLCQ